MIDKLCDSNLPSNTRSTIVKSENNDTTTNSQQQKRIKLQSFCSNKSNNNTANNNNNNNNNSSSNNNNNNDGFKVVQSKGKTQITNTNGHSHTPLTNGSGQSNINSPNHPNGSDQTNKPNLIPYPSGPSKQLNKTELYPPTPSILVQSQAEIFSPQLQEFCLANPIVVIRNISRVLELNLGLFSTKTLVELDAGHLIEVRTQLEQPSDENWDHEKKTRIWLCESPRNFSRISKYALYQARTFVDYQNKTENNNSPSDDFTLNEDNSSSMKRDPDLKYVTFGTNVDLSDSRKWKPQLDELDKLPMFSRVVSASNMLSHVGHPILGMNTVQLYMKVPGCRTPGHQENNNFCSVNINIGPGDCEWFGVPEEYWGPMAKLCAENNTNFVHGSWWPNLDDLRDCGIPVYRFIQKPGDLVWVNTGTVHWVQATGWCNNIAWNVGPITSKQFRSAIERYEWNKLERYKSIVPMIHLTWNLVRNVEIHDEDLFHVMKSFMTTTLSFCERIIQHLEKSNIEIKWHGKAPHEAAHYCVNCEIEVFNILFVKAIEKKLVVHCMKCALEVSQILENFVVLQEYDMGQLKETYSNFIRSFRSQQRSAMSSSTSMLTNGLKTQHPN